MPDYRDRASVLIWVVLMGLAAQRFLELPTRTLTTALLGSPIAFTITTNTVLGALLAGLVASGTEAVVLAHPRSLFSGSLLLRPSGGSAVTWIGQSTRENALVESRVRTGANGYGPMLSHWVFWALPVALVTVALLLLPVAPSSPYWLVGLITTGIALGLSMAGLFYTIDPFATGYRRARLGMNALTYAVALVLFLVVYRTRVRSVVSATEITLVSSLLALELLRGSERPVPQLLLYAGVSGLVLGQATWALNYWRLNSLTGGLVLLLLFYNIVGLAQNGLSVGSALPSVAGAEDLRQGPIRRRVVVEHGLITVAALALIWRFAP